MNSLKSLNTLNKEKVYLIVGGRAKDKNFKNLCKYRKLIKKLYIYGESSKLIFNQVKKDIKCNTYSESVNYILY